MALCLVALHAAGLAWWVADLRDARVVSVFPRDGEAAVPAGSPVLVVFDRSLGEHGHEVEVRLEDSRGAVVPSSLHVAESRATAELRPLHPLAPGDYRVRAEVPGVVAPARWSFTVPRRPPLSSGPGGPVLLVTSPEDPVDELYAEILRAEGFTAFSTVDRDRVTRRLLDRHRVVLVTGDAGAAAGPLSAWVRRGGRLVTVRPRGALARLAGHRGVRRSREGGRLLVRDSSPVGLGRDARLRLHGGADLVGVDGSTRVVATTTATSTAAPGVAGRPWPAVTLRDAGRGRVGALTFDLARSVALIRQGDPHRAGGEGDGGRDPVRTNDLFVGVRGDEGFLDLDELEVPHVDEQMRLLSNLVGVLTADRTPLPRLWYFPKGAEAVVVLAADDHGTESGTYDLFAGLEAADPAGCDPDRWECLRATSWLYPDSGLGEDDAARFVSQGFDVGTHVTTGCANWSPESLDRAFGTGFRAFRRVHPDLPAQRGSRLHCVVWTDYLTHVLVEQAWGVRLDMNYYSWPADWLGTRAGFMTGSGIPMRFSDLDGGLVDVFQQPTHLVDEVLGDAPQEVAALLDRARGPAGYYGAFGVHVDFGNDFATDVVEAAVERGVPVVSAAQLLDWLDGREASTVGRPSWSRDQMTFEVHADARTRGMLQAMLPVHAMGGALATLYRDGRPVRTTVREVKGVDYAFFAAAPGAYAARYGSARRPRH